MYKCAIKLLLRRKSLVTQTSSTTSQRREKIVILSLKFRQNKYAVTCTTVFAKLEGLLVRLIERLQWSETQLLVDNKVKYAKVRYVIFSVAQTSNYLSVEKK